MYEVINIIFSMLREKKRSNSMEQNINEIEINSIKYVRQDSKKVPVWKI